jgi:hypothetical protein
MSTYIPARVNLNNNAPKYAVVKEVASQFGN